MEVRGWKKLKFLSAKKFSRLIVATIARPRQTFVMTTIIQVSLLGTKVTILIGTLESGINIRVRLLIFGGFSRGYVLIKEGYVY